MRKLFFTALMATALLGLAVGTASARNLSLLNGERGYSIDWRDLEFSNNLTSEIVRCHVHLEGSFTATTIAKRERTGIGRTTRATVDSCTNGTGIPHINNGWEVRYRGFSGTLPVITLIFLDMPNASFTIETGSLTCESNLETNNPARGRALLREDGAGLQLIYAIVADESVNLPLRGGLCPLGRGRFGGTGDATVLGETRTTSVALI